MQQYHWRSFVMAVAEALCVWLQSLLTALNGRLSFRTSCLSFHHYHNILCGSTVEFTVPFVAVVRLCLICTRSVWHLFRSLIKQHLCNARLPIYIMVINMHSHNHQNMTVTRSGCLAAYLLSPSPKGNFLNIDFYKSVVIPRAQPSPSNQCGYT